MAPVEVTALGLTDRCEPTRLGSITQANNEGFSVVRASIRSNLSVGVVNLDAPRDSADPR
jgi:hypothetical protein